MEDFFPEKGGKGTSELLPDRIYVMSLSQFLIFYGILTRMTAVYNYLIQLLLRVL